MSLPVPSELAPRKERLWPAALVSVAFHAAVITWAMLRTSGPEIDLDQKPIVAKLVRLGEKRPEHLLPRKEEPPPAPAAPVVAAPTPAVATAPAPPTAPVPGAKPVPQSAKPPPAPASSAERASRIASLLSAQRQRTASGASEPVYGDPNGDPLGDSSEGVGDQYVARVIQALRENYDVPTTISEKERLYLSADVVVQIDPDGKIVRWKVVRPSDNPLFNSALERTLRLTPRLPPPPVAERDRYRSGVTVQFKI